MTHSSTDRALEVLVSGNLSVLTPAERLDYYHRVCESLNLNPLTKPLEFIVLNGKLTLYALKGAADQLRQQRGVNIVIEDQRQVGDLYMVTVTAVDSTGRRDSDMGVVSTTNLSGENLANAILKAITKAKRRVTLSICGLGMLDETEVEDIPASAKRQPVIMPQPRVAAPVVDTETGEVLGAHGTDVPDWSTAELGRLLHERALSMRDLEPLCGPGVLSRETAVEAINAWLREHPDMSLAALVAAAVPE